MMAERALSPEEVWLQDSEARLESMEILLKSVRRDIDALSEKIPSPRSGAHSTFHQGETIIHESGSKRYVMEMERGSRGLHNLGLGSHTAFEPFDNEEEAEKPGREPHPHKSWRSPSDFRQDESPPGSPTFGESSNIISLHDVILHSENVTPSPQEDASRTIPLLGSQHSLPTIEENSQEDNLLTDTDTSSISTNDELKSADCAYEHRSQTAVSCARSCDTVVVAADAGQSDNSASKRPLEETMILRREHGRRQQPPSDRPRSGSPFLSNSDSFRFSHTSLRSRDSIVSDTDSYMTVNSQLFPSGEEVYVTACSDNDTPGDSPDDGRTLVRGRTRQKLLILQQTTPSECYNQSDDVLEFTLVEAPACETPTAEKEVESAHLDNPPCVPDKSFQKPVKRRALRKRRPEEDQIYDDSDTSSSSTCEEAVYDATTAKVVESAVPKVADETPLAVWTNRLSCIEEKSCLTSGLDSSNDEEDIVVHYGDNDDEEERQEIKDDILEIRVALQTNSSMPITAEDVADFDQEPFRFVEDSSTFQPSPVPTAEKPATLGQSGADPELVASTSLSDSHPSNESPQPHTMPSLTPRVHLPQLRMEDRTRRARHDHYFVCPKSPNAFFMGDTGQSSPISVFTTNDKPDLQQRSTQRSKSVSRLPERKFSNHGTFNGSAGVDAVQSNASNGRMYSRSCFRYRSTDIDVALATATASRENLAGSHFGDDSKKKTAASLFDLSAKIQPLTTTNLQSLNGKSTNSLLETDIDTGMQNGQQIILETDVDTLNTYRLVGGFTGSEQGTIQSNQDKAYSLFNLSSYSNSGPTRVHQTDELQHESRADAYKRTQSLSGIAKSGDGQRSDQKAGASGLIARLRARARSNHELRVAESLTRIHVPEWLDKADLSRPISPQRREPSPSPTREKAALPRYGTSLPSTTLLQSTISTSLDAKTKGTKTVETVAKPTWSPAPQKRSDFKRPLRPSQILRERNASSGPRLVPIKSSLRSSMRSQVIGGTNDASIDRGAVIRTSTPGSKRCPVRLDPEDFLTHDEKVWGEKSIPQSLPPVVCTNGASAELVQAPKTTPTVPTSPPIPKPSPRTPSRAGQLVRRNGETHIVDDVSSIKMADSESLIENQFYQSMDNNDGVQYTSRFDDEGIYEEVRRPSKLMPPPLSLPRPSPLTSPTSTITSRSPIHSSTWHHADSDGETETMATDGLDNISDLTCLTDLLDKCSGRHLALLQNRPSALENLLSQLGWWSSTPSAKPRQQLRGSGDFVALAAGRFDPDEDSHRHEFLSLLASPAGQGPMILTEYGFDQKRIGLDRNPKDGMLYLHCSNPSCPRLGPTRVDKARSWRTCTNCFTAYCSTRCREQGTHAHSSVCTFGRARLVCGRILHQLAPSQQSGLTALAKAGTTRLGRGGIVIAFASAQDAEYFLARCAALPLKQQNQQAEPVAADRPSPSGLLAPPIYLTVEEVSKLDSKLAAPCKIYKPSVSYVLIVIVCAYDLEVMKCGRAVHLYKQSIILPFPGATAVDAPRSQLPLLKETTISWTQPQTTKEEREAYSKRLQRTLRERGVSLRNSEPEVYKRLSAFVETGEAFDPVEFDFHDYYSNQVITCTIAPMKDAVIRQKMITRPDERHRNYPYKQNHRPLKPRIGETEL